MSYIVSGGAFNSTQLTHPVTRYNVYNFFVCIMTFLFETNPMEYVIKISNQIKFIKAEGPT